MALTPGILSGSTDGKPIDVTSTTSGAADTIHTGVASATNIDFLWLDATNDSAADVDLYLGWGGVSAAETIGPITIPASGGPQRVAERWPIRNSQLVKAWASSASDIKITGYKQAYTA